VLRPLALGLVAVAGCAPSSPKALTPSYEYAITPPPAGSPVVHVEAELRNAPVPRLWDPDAKGALRDVALVGPAGPQPLAVDGEGWTAPSCRTACTLRFDLDLDVLARRCRGFDCARRIGGAVLGPASMWMLRPDANVDADIHAVVRGGDPTRFATGLRSDGRGGYSLRTWELGEASYTAFGDMRRRRLDVSGVALDVALLGAPLAMGDDAALAWIRDAATCVAQLYGTFPAQATIFVVPVKGADEVVFGRVMSLAGGSVALLFGADTPPSREHSDWVVVHELSHLGTASLVGEAHWLEEGLATYYEPILRARAGWMTEAELWRHFVDQMPRGLRKADDPPSLEERDDIDSTYWGGALYVMQVDLAIRRATRGQRSFDDAMRAVRERLGDATHGTYLADFLRVGDEATGTSAFAQVTARFAQGGADVDLPGIWRFLGVEVATNGAVSLRDDAPGAALRRSIATGERH
jgi:hypothetical protein